MGALSLAGCASIGLDPPRAEDTPREIRSALKPEPKPLPTITQNGAAVDVRVQESCLTRHWHDYDRVTVEERRNESKGLTWFKAIVGVGLIGGGVPILVDAHSVGSSSGTTGTNNPVGQGGAYAIGAGLAAVGALALGSALYDVGSAHGAQRTPNQVEKDETFTGPLACTSAAPGGIVGLDIHMGPGAGHGVLDRVILGPVDTSGAGHFDLVRAVPPEKLTGQLFAMAGTLVFVADGTGGVAKGEYPIGDIDLKPARARHATSAWGALDKESCRHAETTMSCNPVKAFANSYPDSSEKAQADALLVEAEPLLEKAADNDAWAASQHQECATPKSETACAGVEAYLSQRDKGLHATEARRLVGRAKHVIDRLRAAREAAEQTAGQYAAQREKVRRCKICVAPGAELNAADHQFCGAMQSEWTSLLGPSCHSECANAEVLRRCLSR